MNSSHKIFAIHLVPNPDELVVVVVTVRRYHVLVSVTGKFFFVEIDVWAMLRRDAYLLRHYAQVDVIETEVLYEQTTDVHDTQSFVG